MSKKSQMAERGQQTQHWIARPPLNRPDLSARLAQRASHRRVVRGVRETRSDSPAPRTRTPSAQFASSGSKSANASTRESEGWTLLRRVRVQQVQASDAVAQIRAKIEGPEKAARAMRALHINSEDFTALTSSDAFAEIDVDAALAQERRASAPGSSRNRSSPADAYAYEPKQAALSDFGRRLETWVHCTPSDEEDVFVVIIQARLGSVQAIADAKCAWRLCSGVARSIPEMTSFGINSVDIDGARQLPTPAGFKLELMPHQCRSLSWMIMRETFGQEEWCVNEYRVDRPIELKGVDLRLEVKTEDAFYLRGGLLCDVVGSGKTATILALVREKSTYSYVPLKCRSGDCATSTKATLVLCPSNVHAQWLSEVDKFCPDKFKAISIRTLADLQDCDVAHLMEADLVVAPYDVIAVDSSPVPLPLERMSWHRLVLDEFHEICSKRAARHNQLLSAIQSLEAAKRWGMSGTPESFLSSPASVAQAAKFFRCCVNIRSAPTFVEHFCRQARMRMPVEVHNHVVMVSQTPAERAVYYQRQMDGRLPQHLDWSLLRSFLEEKADLVQALLRCCSHFSTNAEENPETETAEEVCERMFARMRNDVNQAKIQLMNVICAIDPLKSQPKFHTLAQKALDISCGRDRGLMFFEHDIKDAYLFEEACSDFQLACTRLYDAAIEDEDFAEVVDDMREACNAVTSSLENLEKHVAFKAKFEAHPDFKGKIPDYIQRLKDGCGRTIDVQRRYMFFKRTSEALNGEAGAAECPICLEPMDAFSSYILFCGHALCMDCAPRLTAARCPVCRYQIPQLSGYSVRLLAVPPRMRAPSREEPEKPPVPEERAHWSSKLRMLVETLEGIHSREPSAKVIVFMQWERLKIQTSGVLKEIGVEHLSLEGDIFARTHALQEFQTNGNISLLLLSLENSASGTNLTVASHVFLMHPMLASSQEEASSYEAQAIGRVVRLGQTRPVHVWRFVTSHTLEEGLWEISATDS